MSEETLTGRQIFMRFAGPCGEIRFLQGLITFEKFQEIDLYWLNNIEPSAEFLEECFPDAVKSYKEFCKKQGFEYNWSVTSVLNYWRYGHDEAQGHFGDCEVRLLTVLSIKGEIVDVGLKYPVKNRVNIPLTPGDLVLVHHRNIAIKI